MDEDEIPDGTAVFPEIPEELGVQPLLLAVLHTIVFLEGSSAEAVNRAAADEALDRIVSYLGRLEGKDLRRVREDFAVLAGYARSENWPKAEIQFLKAFLAEVGLGDS